MHSVVTNAELAASFRRCRPPLGWPRKIAVANSGGPDSTCLLFLLKRLVSNSHRDDGLPEAVVSLSVNHNLQASSSGMAEHSARIAGSLDTEHYTSTIEWGMHPFPPLPPPGKSIETIARNLRYHLLFTRMKETGANAIAFGHHIDDQIETALMRMSKGTTELGAGGMRPCRRWGMDTGAIPGFKPPGIDGMSRWIVRPLLDFPKTRLLATCHANGLEYATDPTNFQPELTLRNAIRHLLGAEETETTELPQELQSQLQNVQSSIKSLKELSGGTDTRVEGFRDGITALAERYDAVQDEASAHLVTHRLPSTIGTFTLSTTHLSRIQDETVRSAMVLRILRYISPHPWGSTRAEGDRNQAAIQRQVDLVWHPNPQTTTFSGKSGVKWTLVNVDHEGNVVKSKTGGEKAWIASRASVYSGMKLEVDVTEGVRACEGREVEILWDNRFAVRFQPERMPGVVRDALQSGARLRIEADEPWITPRLVLKSGQDGKLILLSNEEGGGWISTEFIRVIDAL